MIFVTAGTQLPFDRLIKTIDEIAPQLSGTEFVVQALKPKYKVQNIEVLDFISPSEFNAYMENSQLIISHAGTGTIISALIMQKPIIIMPRLAKYKEHKNDHQLATAKKMDSLGYVEVAYNENDLIDKFYSGWPEDLKPRFTIGNYGSDMLLNSLSNFIKY